MKKKKEFQADVTVVDNQTGEMVRYSNRLDTFDVAKMSPRAQDLMSFCFLCFRNLQEENLEIPFSIIRKRLNLAGQRNSYTVKIIAEAAFNLLDNQSPIVCMRGDDGGRFSCGYLINRFDADAEAKTLKIRVDKELLKIFNECSVQNRYVKYFLDDFFQIRSKYSKNLFRLLCANFHGVCTISNKELRRWMDMSETMANKEVVRIIKKAADDLRQKNKIKKCEITTSYSTKGLESVSFKFFFPDLREKPEELPEPEKKLSLPPKLPKSDDVLQGIPEEQALANAYFESIGQLKGKDEMDRLAICLQVHGLLKCLQAIEIAKENNGRSIGYVETVLKNGIRDKKQSRGYQMPGIHATITDKIDPDIGF